MRNAKTFMATPPCIPSYGTMCRQRYLFMHSLAAMANKIVLYDSKPYWVDYFTECNKQYGFDLHFIEERLCMKNVHHAKGAYAVCTFVNDEGNKAVLAALANLGVKQLTLRCAGFDKVTVYFVGRRPSMKGRALQRESHQSRSKTPQTATCKGYSARSKRLHGRAKGDHTQHASQQKRHAVVGEALSVDSNAVFLYSPLTRLCPPAPARYMF